MTRPGADGVLAKDPSLAEQVIRPHVELSVTRHASPVVAVVGHYDCLANAVDEDPAEGALTEAAARSAQGEGQVLSEEEALGVLIATERTNREIAETLVIMRGRARGGCRRHTRAPGRG